MSKYKPRVYKKIGGKKATIPIKSKKEVNAILNYFLSKRDKAKSDVKRWQADRNYMIVKLALNTAFRAEDLLQLCVIDLEKGYISIIENKTKKVQNFRMNKRLHTEILEYIERNKLSSYDYMFSSQKNRYGPVTRQNTNGFLAKAAKYTGLKQQFSMHSIRKTFAYQYYKNGGNLITLMKMLNHDSPETTLIYINWDNEDVDKSRSDIYI